MAHLYIRMGMAAAYGQIKKYGAADNGHCNITYRKSCSLLCQVIHNAAVCLQSEGRTAGKNDSMDFLHRLFRTQ